VIRKKKNFMSELIDKLEELPPMDRWRVVDQRIKTLERKTTVAARGTSEVATVLVSKLAEQARVSTETMLKQLKDGGAVPFKLGKEWFVREVALVEFYERQERKHCRK